MTDQSITRSWLMNKTVDLFFSKSLLTDQEKQLKKMNKCKSHTCILMRLYS